MTARFAGRVCLVTGSTGIAAPRPPRDRVRRRPVFFIVSRTADHASVLASEIQAAGSESAWQGLT